MTRPMPLLAVTALAGALFAATPSSAFSLDVASPFGFGADTPAAAAQTAPPVRMAQAGGDPFVRIDQLQEEIRSLNGRIEDLTFQILQMQENMRKQQEDNEFRLQELEGGSSGGGGGDAAPASSGGRRSEATPAPTGGARATASAESADSADPIRDVLEGGLDVGSVGSTPPTGGRAAASAQPSQTVAAITPAGAGELYDLAYNYLLAGDYQLAEDSFRQYSQAYPNAKDAPDAQYWLGESQFAQGEFADAAETFLNAQKNHPKSAKAPEMMLKLGMALAKLDNRETACVTFAEVSKRYPDISASVSRKLAAEKKNSRCG